jgi:hypothetical protein
MVNTTIPFERIQKIARSRSKFQSMIGESSFFSSVEITEIQVHANSISCEYREGRRYREINFYPDESGGTNIEAKVNWTATIIMSIALFGFYIMVGRLDIAHAGGAFLLAIPLFIVIAVVASHLTKDQIPNEIKDRIIQRILSIENGEEID